MASFVNQTHTNENHLESSNSLGNVVIQNEKEKA